VSIEEIQAAYYMVAATGVLVAAGFYVMNLRETMKNRRAALANNMQQTIETEDWQKRFMNTLNMQWSDFEDFKRKYDSSVDVESYARRFSVLITYDNYGQQFRLGVIDLDAFSDVWALGIVCCWIKFKEIVEGYRKWQYPKGAFTDFELLANALKKKMIDSDPEFLKKINLLLETQSMKQ
jgi:hypothetical protein